VGEPRDHQRALLPSPFAGPVARASARPPVRAGDAPWNFERTVGHFAPVACGSGIAYAEDVTTLLRDIQEIKPTIMVSAPRLYEKIYSGVQEKLKNEPKIKQKLFAKTQELGKERFHASLDGNNLPFVKKIAWSILDKVVNKKLRDKMGGRIKFFVSGGAALDPKIADFLLASDIQVLCGYGLSESSPVLTTNPPSRNKPDTVGPAIPGVELKILEDGELLARGPMIMQGYWNKPKDTDQVLDSDGWLHTGDVVEIDSDGYVKIKGRKKEILVLSNGENIAPSIVEQYILKDGCVLQTMAIGDSMKYISAIVIINKDIVIQEWEKDFNSNLPDNWKESIIANEWLLTRINQNAKSIPNYARVRKIILDDCEWTQKNGMLTPTLKLKREKILKLYEQEIKILYK